MKRPHLVLVFGAAAVVTAVVVLPRLRAEDAKKTANQKSAVMEVSKTAPDQPEGPVEKTDEQWKKELTPEQYRILRKANTEQANGKVYKEFMAQGGGTYYCAACGAELFSSKEKFDSHCGWPSFYDPSKAKNVKTKTDFVLGYARTEVLCAVCGGHLGHVFEGEGFDTPTDKRYCINGTVLKFVPKAEVDAEAKKKQGKVAREAAAAKAKAEAKARVER